MLLNPSIARGSSFGDDFSVPRSVCAVEAMRHTYRSFVGDFCVTRGCLGCRSNAAPVVALSLMMSESLGLFALSNPCATHG